MDRLDSHREIAEQVIRSGKAYYCYAAQEKLEALRAGPPARAWA